jgi:hypothetical protein
MDAGAPGRFEESHGALEGTEDALKLSTWKRWAVECMEDIDARNHGARMHGDSETRRLGDTDSLRPAHTFPSSTLPSSHPPRSPRIHASTHSFSTHLPSPPLIHATLQRPPCLPASLGCANRPTTGSARQAAPQRDAAQCFFNSLPREPIEPRNVRVCCMKSRFMVHCASSR